MPKDWDAAHRAAPLIPRIELPSLQGIGDSEARFYLTMYLRGAQESDHATARERCAAAGIDYERAKAEASRT
jgi:hypothetical protein